MLGLLSMLWMISFLSITSEAFRIMNTVRHRLPSKSLEMSNFQNHEILGQPIPHYFTTFQLADTSVSEEDVLSVTGQAINLPDPIFAIVLAGILLIGIGILQFSLGDLTKEVNLIECLN